MSINLSIFSHTRGETALSLAELFLRSTAFSEPSFFLKNSNTSISAATFKSYFYQNRKGWMNYVKRCNIFLISASNISSVKNQVCELLNLSSYEFLLISLFFAKIPKETRERTSLYSFSIFRNELKTSSKEKC